MATQWLRRAVLLAASASALLLTACGGGSIASQFSPDRVIAFGDAMADVGNTGSRYTVNDGSLVWTQYVAREFDRALTPATTGGLSYATGNARVAAKPDAAGDPATPTVQEQIDTFQASSAFTTNDLVIMNAGTSDVIVQAQAVLSGAQTETQMLENLTAAAQAFADQARRVVSAGATHVAVVGTTNLGRSPWALQTGQQGLLESASRRFNQQLLVSLVDLGGTVLYIDAELQFNLYVSDRGVYALDNVTDPVCTSVDPGPGVGTGNGQVNSRLCTPATLSSAEYAKYLFADRVYPTPRGHELFGEYARTRIRDRW
jgi:phospholipase/lecithinase/hemolysin